MSWTSGCNNTTVSTLPNTQILLECLYNASNVHKQWSSKTHINKVSVIKDI